MSKFNDQNIDVIFGNTFFTANSKFQEFAKAISYGNISHETTPGSILKRDLFEDKNLFLMKI